MAEPVLKTENPDCLEFRESMISEYLDELQAQGRSDGTIATYRWALGLLYQALPEDRMVYPGTLNQIRVGLHVEGYSSFSLHSFTTASNGLMEFLGHREFQAGVVGEMPSPEYPGLTREEYRRILAVAARHKKERTYLIIKLLAITGIQVSQLSGVTVEAVREGRITVSGSIFRIPEALAGEILDYAGRRGIMSGPVFKARNGNDLDRAYLRREIGALSGEAGVAREKCTPRCLHRLYLKTQEDMHRDIDVLMARAVEQLVDDEQGEIGWDVLSARYAEG